MDGARGYDGAVMMEPLAEGSYDGARGATWTRPNMTDLKPEFS